VAKVYDRDMKGFIFAMGDTSKLSLPADDSKLGLGLT
jgi:hypothetical protein